MTGVTLIAKRGEAMAHRGLLMSLLALTVVGPAAAQSYRDGRIRLVERGVSLQRADESGAEEAVANTPILPGDRVWTDNRGRVEFQFAEGTVLRLDRRSKLDYVAREQDRRGESIVLRLFSGGLFLHVRDRHDPADFTIEAGGGVFHTHGRGVFRVEAARGQADLSVYEGEAQFEGAERVRVRAGERLLTRQGDIVENPVAFDRREADDFAAWDSELDERAWSGDVPEYLPDEVEPYASDLANHGAWYDEVEVGHVWVPYVSAGWRPYWNGHWTWTAYGWTWVPYEPWGWAPFHYGRWGWSTRLGWYWIPGRTWGPAWVSWSVSGDSIGWCALGHRNRPVFIHEARGGRTLDRAVPRGSVAAPGSAAWVFARRQDLTARDVAVRRFGSPLEAKQVVEVSHGRLGRDLQVKPSDDPAVPRVVRTKPGPGDTVPELQDDNMLAVPRAVPRTRYETERERDRERGRPRRGYNPQQQQETGGQQEGSHGEVAAPRSPYGRPAVPLASDPAPAEARPRPAPAQESDREVMRPVFERLGRPNREGEGERAERARPRSDGDDRRAPGGYESFRKPRQENEPARERPRVQPPPPPPPPPKQSGADENRAVHRKKDKDN
jgi:hypothetical protein